MKPKISIITLGVDDLERATHFYADGLGLPKHDFEGGKISFFSLHGTWLALYPRDELAKDIGLAVSTQAGFSGIALAHNVASKAEVDAVLDQAVSAGARLIKPAVEVFWGGYSGYFQDTEGHYWEVAYNLHQDLT
ncbi:MAG: catechol 2,3-dioxygenase-like lactoylglutathione lyase family enzyme [Cycloclasticus pugetii]|jgi:catechol 2,3-dioxygenase-like lactoylglutathione lyase family enzyme|uniref:VOC family protein n=1 Tax=Cycloclasticus TaxID=34067 RepID=UPI00257C17F8|nr:VOC family protein [Cycloclasticus sp.]MBV1899431.1 VOC family protein [Cycloclasticus sp.]